MKSIRWVWVLAVWLMCGGVGLAQDDLPAGDGGVTIVFKVTVPVDTPEADTVYLSGDHMLLGNWSGRGLALERQHDGTYQGRLSLMRGVGFEFKATRGSWETVEKSMAGGDIENRSVFADRDREVEFAVASWSSGVSDRPGPSLVGDIRKHEGFRSEILDNKRTLIVYLPPGYEAEGDRRYPVLYMHDGQNLFDASTSFAGYEWRVDEAAERLIAAGKIEPIIIVGMYNHTDRMTEYTPRPVGDEVDAYARFVAEEVKPFIDQTYRTDPSREKTGVAGSSLGGLISLYMVWAQPETFGRCGGVSPSLWWGGRWLIEQWRGTDMAWAAGAKIWIDMGSEEGRRLPGGGTTGVLNARELAGLLKGAGLKQGEGYQYLEVEGGEHNEQAWSRRIDAILTYLYGTP